MIIVRIMCGLGNQMFEYAAGRALALRLGAELKLDAAWFDNKREITPRKYALDIFPLQVSQATRRESEALRFIPRSFIDKILFRPARNAPSYLREPHFQYWPAVENIRASAYLDGHWQSERYFADHADVIRRDFTFPSLPEDSETSALAENIRRTPNATAVHVRRGDYAVLPSELKFHGLCPPEYYRDALDAVSARAGNDIRLFIFSDEPDWVRRQFDCSGKKATVVDCPGHGAEPWRDMFLMSLCRHHVIANSSFSWWGAWLADTDGVVCAPSAWFADAAMDTRDLCPPSWRRI